MRRRTVRRGVGGFTLIEVLVALAVLAFAMAAIVRSTSTAAGNAAHLRDRTLAQWVAINKVTELQLDPEWPAVGVNSGNYEMAGRDWRWEAKVSGTDDETVRRLDVTVLDNTTSKNILAVVVAYLDRPL